MHKVKLRNFLKKGVMSISELAKVAEVDRKRIYDVLSGNKVSDAVNEKIETVIDKCDTNSKPERQLKDEWLGIPTYIRNKSKLNEFLYCECRKSGFTEFTVKKLIQEQYLGAEK